MRAAFNGTAMALAVALAAVLCIPAASANTCQTIYASGETGFMGNGVITFDPRDNSPVFNPTFEGKAFTSLATFKWVDGVLTSNDGFADVKATLWTLSMKANGQGAIARTTHEFSFIDAQGREITFKTADNARMGFLKPGLFLLDSQIHVVSGTIDGQPARIWGTMTGAGNGLLDMGAFNARWFGRIQLCGL